MHAHCTMYDLNLPSQHVLHACSTGDLNKLSSLFANYNIRTPAIPITPHNAISHLLPETHVMVMAAIPRAHLPTIIYIYSIFPSAPIIGLELAAAIEHGDLRVFQAVAKQRGEVPNREFCDGETSLCKACKGSRGEIALWLLENGADPNGLLELGIKGPLENAIAGQSLRVIEKLVECGAVIEDGHLKSAIDCWRVDVLKILVRSARARGQTVHFQELIERAHRGGMRDSERLLREEKTLAEEHHGTVIGTVRHFVERVASH